MFYTKTSSERVKHADDQQIRNIMGLSTNLRNIYGVFNIYIVSDLKSIDCFYCKI